MLHIAKWIDRRFAAGQGAVVRVVAALSVLALLVGAVLLAGR